MGDDLAVNSEQMIGLSAKDEFPVVWKIFGITSQQSYSCSFHFRPTKYLPLGLRTVLVLGGLFSASKVQKRFSKSFFKKITKATKQILTLVSKKELKER